MRTDRVASHGDGDSERLADAALVSVLALGQADIFVIAEPCESAEGDESARRLRSLEGAGSQ